MSAPTPVTMALRDALNAVRSGDETAARDAATIVWSLTADDLAGDVGGTIRALWDAIVQAEAMRRLAA